MELVDQVAALAKTVRLLFSYLNKKPVMDDSQK